MVHKTILHVCYQLWPWWRTIRCCRSQCVHLLKSPCDLLEPRSRGQGNLKGNHQNIEINVRDGVQSSMSITKGNYWPRGEGSLHPVSNFNQCLGDIDFAQKSSYNSNVFPPDLFSLMQNNVQNGTLGYYCRKTTSNIWHKCILYKAIRNKFCVLCQLARTFLQVLAENKQKWECIIKFLFFLICLFCFRARSYLFRLLLTQNAEFISDGLIQYIP